MATGTTADYVLTRNDIIASALRKIKGWPEDGNPPIHKLREAIRALNLIVRAEDLKQTELSQSLWALYTSVLDLTAGRYHWSSSESLPNILQLNTVFLRSTDGDDTELDIVSTDDYHRISNKVEVGTPQRVHLYRQRLLSSQILSIWPSPSTVTAGDTVVVSLVTYTCIQGHTSSSENKPGTGASWNVFWRAGAVAVGADTWVTATDYDNGDHLILHYKRPLYDFDLQTDNPDFPLGWEDYFIYKLAIRLAPEYDLGMDSKQELKNDLKMIEAELFPSTRERTNTFHNKTCFY